VITLELEEIFNSIKTGKITSAQARKLLSLYSIQKIENLAKMDIDRKKRRGIPEVIFAENKEFNDIKKIVESVLRKSNSVLISRLKKKDNLKLKSYAKKSKLRSSVGKAPSIPAITITASTSLEMNFLSIGKSLCIPATPTS